MSLFYLDAVQYGETAYNFPVILRVSLFFIKYARGFMSVDLKGSGFDVIYFVVLRLQGKNVSNMHIHCPIFYIIERWRNTRFFRCSRFISLSSGKSEFDVEVNDIVIRMALK